MPLAVNFWGTPTEPPSERWSYCIRRLSSPTLLSAACYSSHHYELVADWSSLFEGRNWSLVSAIPRPKRVCRHCTLGEVEHVHHLLLRCPAYSTIRHEAKYLEIFTRPWENLHSFLSQENRGKVASFALQCYDRWGTLGERAGAGGGRQWKQKKRKRTN